MQFRTLNGWPLPDADGSASMQRTTVGDHETAITNKPLRRRRQRPRGWRGRAVCLDESTADAVEGLVLGRGHRISFDRHAWSESGLGPNDGGTYSVVESPSFARFGPGYGSVTSITWNADLRDDKWTVLLWRHNGTTWDHYSLRSDLARWLNGVRADATPATFASVTDGALTLTGAPTPYDDVVILPYLADAAQVEAHYRWFGAAAMVAYWQLNGIADNAFGGIGDVRDGVVTGAVFAYGGQIERYLSLGAAPADRMTVASDADLSPDVADPFTIELWLRLAASTISDRNIVEKLETAAPAEGYRVRHTSAGTIAFDLRDDLTNVVTVTDDEQVDSVWHHYCFVSTGTAVAIYRDAVLRSSSSTASLTGTIVSTTDFALGSLRQSLDAVVGDIDDAKFFRAALTQNEIRDHYRCGRFAARIPGPQPFSALPHLRMTGDALGCLEVDVLGMMSGQSYDAFSTVAGGLLTNARHVDFSLDELQAPEKPGTVRAYSHWLLRRDHIDPLSATSLRASSGRFAGVLNVPAIMNGAAGPFGLPSVEGATFGGAGERVELTTATVLRLERLRRCAVLAWIRRASIGAAAVVVDLSATVGSKLRIELDVADALVVRVKPASTETQLTFTTSASIADTDDHLVGFLVDLDTDGAGADLVEVFVDGESVDSTVPAFTVTEFDDDAGAAHYIGESTGGGVRFDGVISSVSFYDRRPSAFEMRKIYEDGRRGVLR